VPSNPLSADTAPDVEQRQIQRWRQMSAAEKAAIVSGLTRAACELARAGVRHRYPDASAREQFLHLAVVILGPDLARRVYPDVALLNAQ
jgi:hypothetical protein